MIRINLLPLRASKKKETVRQQLSILGLSMFGVLVVGLFLFLLLGTKISNAKVDPLAVGVGVGWRF